MSPLLFRERMGTTGTGGVVGKGDARAPRPVYRYIFLCPGQAQTLVRRVFICFAVLVSRVLCAYC